MKEATMIFPRKDSGKLRVVGTYREKGETKKIRVFTGPRKALRI